MRLRLINEGKVIAIVDVPCLIDGHFPDLTPAQLTPFGAEILGVDPETDTVLSVEKYGHSKKGSLRKL